MTEDAKQYANTLITKQKMTTNNNVEILCPDCGQTMIIQGRCWFCPVCGHSTCQV